MVVRIETDEAQAVEAAVLVVEVKFAVQITVQPELGVPLNVQRHVRAESVVTASAQTHRRGGRSHLHGSRESGQVRHVLLRIVVSASWRQIKRSRSRQRIKYPSGMGEDGAFREVDRVFRAVAGNGRVRDLFVGVGRDDLVLFVNRVGRNRQRQAKGREKNAGCSDFMHLSTVQNIIKDLLFLSQILD